MSKFLFACLFVLVGLGIETAVGFGWNLLHPPDQVVEAVEERCIITVVGWAQPDYSIEFEAMYLCKEPGPEY